MERELEKILDDAVNTEGIVGCILADHSGLCLGVKGNASGDSAGIITAIADEATKLEQNSTMPIIRLQSESRQCFILRQGLVTGAIYKDVTM